MRQVLLQNTLELIDSIVVNKLIFTFSEEASIFVHNIKIEKDVSTITKKSITCLHLREAGVVSHLPGRCTTGSVRENQA